MNLNIIYIYTVNIICIDVYIYICIDAYRCVYIYMYISCVYNTYIEAEKHLDAEDTSTQTAPTWPICII